MRLLLTTSLLAATALAGHSSTSKAKAPGMLLTGCPNGYTDIMTGQCKPYHLRVRDAEAGDWRSHKVTAAYPVYDHGHPWGGKHGPKKAGKKDGKKDKDGKPGPGRGWGPHGNGGPNEHCPNGVANHGTGECRPFRLHARDADSGAWREHRATGFYRIPDEKNGHGHGGWGPGHGGPPGGFGGPKHEGLDKGKAGMGGKHHEGKGRPGNFGGKDHEDRGKGGPGVGKMGGGMRPGPGGRGH